MGELVHWAQEAKLERQVVEKLLKERFDNIYAIEGTLEACSVDKTSGLVDEDGVTEDGKIGAADLDTDTVATIMQPRLAPVRSF